MAELAQPVSDGQGVEVVGAGRDGDSRRPAQASNADGIVSLSQQLVSLGPQ